MAPENGTLRGYLFKDAVRNRVYVTREPQKGAKACETRYHTMDKSRDLSLVECELVTGRTHQIRAQFAAARPSLLGTASMEKRRRSMTGNIRPSMPTG